MSRPRYQVSTIQPGQEPRRWPRSSRCWRSPPAVAEIVEAYVQHRLMPADPSFDALHLAMASYHKCEFLVTWNCQHLANANKFGHIRRVNSLLGLYVPVLETPLELLGEKS